MTIVLVHGVPETSVVWDLLAASLVELGHWWMTQDPDRAASVLSSFWASHS